MPSLRWPALLVLPFAFVACSHHPATAVVLAIGSDAAVPADLDEVEITATRGSTQKYSHVYVLPRDGQLPATLTFSDASDDDATLTLHLLARKGDGGTFRVTRDVRLRFVREKSKLLRVRLERACFDKACPDGTTCIGGTCQSPDVDAASLPDFTSNDDAIGTGWESGGGAGAGGSGTAGTGGASGGAGGKGGSGGQGGNAQSGNGGEGGGGGQSGGGGSAGSAGVAMGGGAGSAGVAMGGGAGSAGAGMGGSGGTASCVPTCAAGVLHGCDVLGNATTLDCGSATCDATKAACVPAGATLLTTGVARSCAAKGGAVSCWGDDGSTLGTASTDEFLATAHPVVNGPATVAQLSAGTKHVCAVDGNAAVWCWGNDDWGQLGVAGAPAGPTAVGGLAPDVVEVRAGYRNTSARHADGTVSCWGDDSQGQLGQGTTSSGSTTPLKVPGITDAVALAVDDFACVLHGPTGDVSCWGIGASTPTALGLSGVEVHLGGAHTTRAFVRKADGSVVSFMPVSSFGGWTAPAPVPLPPGSIAAMSVGFEAVYLLSDGSVYTSSFDDTMVAAPAPVLDLGPKSTVAIAAGYDAYVAAPIDCAIRSDGAVVCWGSDLAGALGAGLPSSSLQATAMDVGPLAGNAIASIAAGSSTTAVVLANGAVLATGRTEALGTKTAKLAAISFLASGYDDIRFGDYSDGTAYVHKIGGGVDAARYGALAPGLGLAGIAPNDYGDVAIGVNYDVGQHASGVLQFFAKLTSANDEGELGSDPTMLMPSVGGAYTLNALGQGGRLLSSPPTGTGGRSHNCSSTTSGLFCWGANSNGEIGTGTTSAWEPPHDVSPGTSYISACVGDLHTCAVDTSNVTWCWGDGAYGQNGQVGSVSVPTVVPAAMGASKVFCGGRHTCAVLMSGDVVCWGRNLEGQCGNGTNTQAAAPTAVVGLPGPATTLAVGDVHACALSMDGSIRCWGSSLDGELGTGLTGYFATPQVVKGL